MIILDALFIGSCVGMVCLAASPLLKLGKQRND